MKGERISLKKIYINNLHTFEITFEMMKKFKFY